MHDSFDTPHARTVEPGEYPVWGEALALVDHDLVAHLPDRGPLRLVAMPAWPEEGADDEQVTEHVYVALPDGRWHGNDLPPEGRAVPAFALADVAEAAQETVLGCLWQVWPVCPEHRLGMHAGVEDGQAVWRCAGGGDEGGPGHVQAPVGGLAEPYRSRAERRKLRRRKGENNPNNQNNRNVGSNGGNGGDGGNAGKPHPEG
ncbi:hypothetical protein [Streptomyces maremycinicus]|uniref:hypothetical protein n=1 Tax=Streptomyces maremycinicus TaxID=1679753 RepID=UPI000A66E937|nr:hypothetical protein [Streptomyces sp. NBRC 110468]